VPAQLEAAKKEGETEALAAEKSRRESIVALRDKYNKDGDLDALALKAIADGADADAFKDDVLEAVNKRPTSKRVEDGEEPDADTPQAKIDALRAKIAKETDPVAKGKLAQELRDLRNK
jgi:hypothetical protein